MKSVTPTDAPPVIEFLETEPVPEERTEWVHQWAAPGGDIVLSLGRIASGRLLRFHGQADFALSADSALIRSSRRGGASVAALWHLVVNQVLPRVVTHMGRPVLHASAVHTGSGTIAFVGATGSGKSTLGASFHRAGTPLLSDDAIVLDIHGDAVCARPTYPSLRLWADSLRYVFRDDATVAMHDDDGAKHRLTVRVTPSAPRSAPIAAIYILDPQPLAPAVRIERYSPRDSAMTLLGNTFQLDPTDKRQAAMLFGQVTEVAAHVPMYRLSYRHDYEQLTAVRLAVQDHVGESSRAESHTA